MLKLLNLKNKFHIDYEKYRINKKLVKLYKKRLNSSIKINQCQTQVKIEENKFSEIDKKITFFNEYYDTLAFEYTKKKEME